MLFVPILPLIYLVLNHQYTLYQSFAYVMLFLIFGLFLSVGFLLAFYDFHYKSIDKRNS